MSMVKLHIELGERSYPIFIGTGLLKDASLLASQIKPKNLLIVTNEIVAPLYLQQLKAALTGKQLTEVILPDGEHTKSLDTWRTVMDACVAARLNRDAAMIALGGGVIGDMTGFAAACYQRGVDYIQIPTTLLSQVDSSVGGKTAVNHPGGKNLIGAFHQPRAVIADTEVLNTLADRELRAGLAEVIKYGLIRDPQFFSWIESNYPALLAREPQALAQAIRRSCEIKADIVSLDEREQGLRAVLNLGHTFGHAIENALGYGEWLHGEAVATGMIMAAEMSRDLGWLAASDYDRCVALVRACGLPVTAPRIGAEQALTLMGMDKKVLAGRLRLVLMRSMGDALVTADYDAAVLQAVLQRWFG